MAEIICYQRLATDRADAWHRVTAPGGFEYWHFDAVGTGASAGVQIEAALFDGCPLDGGCRRRYAAYRRWPTHVRPPVAREYPGAFLAVYRQGRPAVQWLTRFAPGSIRASSEDLDVALGSCRAVAQSDGVHLRMRHNGVKAGGCELVFEPATFPETIEHALASRGEAAMEHRWIVGSLACRASGYVELAGQRIEFTGIGYRDHFFATAPPPGCWLWGRVVSQEHSAAFWLTGTGKKVATVVVDGDGNVHVSHAAELNDFRRAGFAQRYPRSIRIETTGGELQLNAGSLVGRSPLHLRLGYEASWYPRRADGVAVNAVGDAHPTFSGNSAVCHMVFAARAGWPVLGRLIERLVLQRD
jgi:hypothetical protein